MSLLHKSIRKIHLNSITGMIFFHFQMVSLFTMPVNIINEYINVQCHLRYALRAPHCVTSGVDGTRLCERSLYAANVIIAGCPLLSTQILLYWPSICLILSSLDVTPLTYYRRTVVTGMYRKSGK